MAGYQAYRKVSNNIPEHCDICYHAFTKTDRSPTIFPCSHTICANCIDRLVMTNPNVCPKCRRPLTRRDPSDFVPFMDVIEEITPSESEPEMPSLKDDSPVKKENEEDEDNEFAKMANTLKVKTEEVYQANLARYAKTSMDIQNEDSTMLDLKNSLLALNIDIKAVIDVLKEAEDKNTNTVSYLEDARKLLLNMQQVKTERVKIMEEYGMKLPLCDDLPSLGSLAGKFKELTKNGKEFEKNLKDFLTKSGDILISMQKECKIWRGNVDRMQSMPNFRGKGDTKTIKLDLSQELGVLTTEYVIPQEDHTIWKNIPQQFLTTEDNVRRHITIDDIREMKEPIKRRLEEGKVFVRHMKKLQHQRLQKYMQMIGRLSVSDEDGVLLHHMTEDESLPPGSHVIEYSAIMQLVDATSRLTFVDLEIENIDGIYNREGRVFFRLSPDTKLGRQFFVMSSGEMGTSYAGGKRDIRVFSKGHSVNECLYIKVGETVLQEDWVNELQKSEYERPQIAGTLCSYYWSEDDNGIAIFTKDDPQRNLSRTFGEVYKGLDVVEKICSFAPGRTEYIGESIDCRINDCGVVIRTPEGHQ